MSTKEFQIPVPYYSQYVDVKNEEWKHRSCGIVCAKMMLAYLGMARGVSLDDFILEGITLGAYSEYGWTHKGIASLAEMYGATLIPQEWRKKINSPEGYEVQFTEGLAVLLTEIRAGRPVIVSVVKKFKYPRKFHMVILVGEVKNDQQITQGLLYHDPEYSSVEEGAFRIVSLAVFQEYWRGMAILCNPSLT